MELFDKRFEENENEDLAKNEPQMPIKGRVIAEKVALSTSVVETLNRKYIAFDVETTGLDPYSDRIVELGAVVFENGQPITQFSTLVNPGMPIPPAATSVNHITNEMLSEAPLETQIYPQLIVFLGDALQGETPICAHNARFDIGFLRVTLQRLGFSGDISYIDTLGLSRKYLTLNDYKQGTVATHYGLINENSHRAASDAMVCGKILWELIKERQTEVEEQNKLLEVNRPTDEELEVCAVIQDAIIKRGANCQFVGFFKRDKYVDFHNLYSIVRFKFASKGRYILIPPYIKTPVSLPIEKCSISEGGTSFVRLYFSSPFDLEFLGDYFFAAYENSIETIERYYGGLKSVERRYGEFLSQMTRLSYADIKTILESARTKKYDAVPSGIKRSIKREEVVVNAVHNRCPLSQIEKREANESSSKGMLLFWEGEEARRNGDYEKAIAYYDQAREIGYDDYFLYESYAITYRKLKDYSNEILIVEEYMARFPNLRSGELEARREKAIELLYDIQQKERIKQEKAIAKAQKLKEKEEAAIAKAQRQSGDSESNSSRTKGKRAILQMDDNGNVIKEFESVTLACKEVGVDSKCIRDAAKGKQKHAGGFAWRYKEDKDTDTVVVT